MKYEIHIDGLPTISVTIRERTDSSLVLFLPNAIEDIIPEAELYWLRKIYQPMLDGIGNEFDILLTSEKESLQLSKVRFTNMLFGYCGEMDMTVSLRW